MKVKEMQLFDIEFRLTPHPSNPGIEITGFNSATVAADNQWAAMNIIESAHRKVAEWGHVNVRPGRILVGD